MCALNFYPKKYKKGATKKLNFYACERLFGVTATLKIVG